MTRALGHALIAMALVGCVSRTAGYDDVRALVRERAGADVRWHAVDDADVAASLKKLLSKPLTARSAVAVALVNSRELQADFEELGLSRAEMVEALALPNPRILAGVHFLEGRDIQYDFEVMIELTRFIFMPLRKGAADSGMEAAKLEVAGRALDVALEVRRAFFEVQSARQGLELRRLSLAGSRAAWEVAQQLHDAGNITDLEWATEHAQYEEARLTLDRAELDFTLRREELSQKMGLWGKKARWKVTAKMAELPGEDPPLAEIERTAVRRSLDLRAAEQRHAAAAGRADVAGVEGWLPGLSAGVELEREAEGVEVGPQVELELPLFDQGQGRVAAAQSDMRREQQRYAAMAIRIRAASRAAAATLREARSRAVFYKDVLLPLRAQVLAETELEYNAMSASVFQLLRAKRDQLDAERAHLEALRDYWMARSDVEQLLAGRLVERAPRPMSAAPATDASSDH